MTTTTAPQLAAYYAVASFDETRTHLVVPCRSVGEAGRVAAAMDAATDGRARCRFVTSLPNNKDGWRLVYVVP